MKEKAELGQTEEKRRKKPQQRPVGGRSLRQRMRLCRRAGGVRQVMCCQPG